jgi:4-hydroxybenzoate polyprenyltransferase
MPTTISSQQKSVPFRANEWWYGKAMLMMGLVYLFTYWFSVSFYVFLAVVLPSLATIIGFAAFGYLVNDYFDRAADAIANKKNSLAGKSSWYILSLFIVSLLFVFLPWLFLPSDKVVFLLIGIELLLFLFYAIPPLRLKERGIIGVCVDALYAHSLPAILAGYTYTLIVNIQVDIGAFLLLFLWQFFTGMRNILMHQYDDMERDLVSSTNTYMVSKSNQIFQLLKPILILEGLSACLFFGVLIRLNLFFGAILFVFVVTSTFVVIIYAQRGFYSFFVSRWRHFPNVFYEKWMPILLLLLLSFLDARFLMVLLIHSLLFNLDYWDIAFQKIKGVYLSIPFMGIFFSIYLPLRMFLSWVINQTIFFFFLLFGVNLKKENCSAMQYLKRKKKKQY